MSEMRKHKRKPNCYYIYFSNSFLHSVPKMEKLRHSYRVFINRPGMVESIKRADDDIKHGRVHRWEDVKAELRGNIERRRQKRLSRSNIESTAI